MAENKFVKTRQELTDKYFDGLPVYEERNMGLVSLLSDLQHMYTSGNDKQSEYWNTILNDIKSILIEDRNRPDIKSIEARINANIEYQTTAEHLKHKAIEQIKKEAEIIGIVSYVSEYIQWDPKKAIRIAQELLVDVNLHGYKVVDLDRPETNLEAIEK